MQPKPFCKLLLGVILNIITYAAYAQASNHLRSPEAKVQEDSTKIFFSSIMEAYNCKGSEEVPFKMVSEGAIRRQVRRDLSFLVLNRDQSTTPGGGITTTISTDK